MCEEVYGLPAPISSLESLVGKTLLCWRIPEELNPLEKKEVKVRCLVRPFFTRGVLRWYSPDTQSICLFQQGHYIVIPAEEYFILEGEAMEQLLKADAKDSGSLKNLQPKFTRPSDEWMYQELVLPYLLVTAVNAKEK